MICTPINGNIYTVLESNGFNFAFGRDQYEGNDFMNNTSNSTGRHTGKAGFICFGLQSNKTIVQL